MDLAEARARARAALRIDVDAARDAFPDIGRLREALAAYRVGAEAARPKAGAAGGAPIETGCRVVLNYRNAAAVATIVLPDSWRVRPEDRLLDDLRVQPRVRAVGIQYA
jgi:hypothetical protein